MSRTREWVKFGTLVGVTLALAVAFIVVIDVPERSLAQQPAAQVLRTRPAPVQPAQPVVDLGGAFVAVAEAVRPAVVYIRAERRVEERSSRQRQEVPSPFDRFFDFPNREDIQPQPPRGQGSGFIISPDGYVMTNNHVVEGFDRLTVRLFDRREFTARVVGRDPLTDIAVIKIDAEDLPAMALGNSDAVQVGEWVLAIGSPLGEDFPFTVTAGIVSGRGRRLQLNSSPLAISDFIQTDAAINPGNSGGPLVNASGQVIGVNSAIASRTGVYAGYSFAIPINLARTVGEQIIEDGTVTRAALGVEVRDAGPEDAEYVGLDEVRGVVVSGIPNDDSPAKRAGIEPGDVIIEVDGERADYTAQLQQIVGFKRPGDQARVTVMRRGAERRTFTVRLMAAGNAEQPRVARADRDDAPEDVSYDDKLGLRLEAMSARMVRDARIDSESRGLIVTAVDPNGPARNRIFPPVTQRGWLDIITHVNGERVQTEAEFDEAVRTVQPNEVVSLRVYSLRGETGQSRIVRLRAGGER
jgi:serine protease Do